MMPAIPAMIIPRIGALIRMLSSPVDGEALNAVRALGRTLNSAGLDLNDLADALAPVRKPRAPRVPRAPKAPQAPREQSAGMKWSWQTRITAARKLRDGITRGIFSAWEDRFASGIIEQVAGPRPRDLSPKQADLVDGLLAKVARCAR